MDPPCMLSTASPLMGKMILRDLTTWVSPILCKANFQQGKSLGRDAQWNGTIRHRSNLSSNITATSVSCYGGFIKLGASMLSIAALCRITLLWTTGLCSYDRDSRLSAGCRQCPMRSSQGCIAFNCFSAQQVKSRDRHVHFCLSPFCTELGCRACCYCEDGVIGVLLQNSKIPQDNAK